jgi:hypothetical protein
MVALAGYQIDGLIGAVIGMLLFWLGVGVAILIELRSQQRHAEWRRRARQEYTHGVAEFSIRSIKRRAVREMLTAERAHHDLGHSGEVIDSTAVEIRQ